MAGVMTAELRSFLELNLPKVKEGKKPKFSLGTSEPKLGSHILEATKIPCQSNEFVLELLRGVRLHFDRFIKDLKMSTLLFLCVWFTVYALCAYTNEESVLLFIECSMVIWKSLFLDLV